MSAPVEVCPECDIAGCRHIRERKEAMSGLDRIWVDNCRATSEGIVGVWGATPHEKGGTEYVRADLFDAQTASLTALQAENVLLREAMWKACSTLEQFTFKDVSDNPLEALEAIETVDGDLSVALGHWRPAALAALDKEAETACPNR